MTLQPSQSSEQAMAKPWIEIKREISVGYFRVYATVYRSPLRVWINGHWVIGRPR